MRRKRFFITFTLGFSIFVALNVYDFWQTKPPCCDASAQFGVPFPLGRTGGYVGATNIRLGGLLVDAFIAVSASILLAFMVEKLFRRRAHGDPEGSESTEVNSPVMKG